MWEKRNVGVFPVLQQPGSVVSKAVCPSNVRHSVALGKMAQQRRLVVLCAAHFAQAGSRFCELYVPAFELQTALMRFIKGFFLLFLLSDGVFLCMSLYNQFLLHNTWFLLALVFVLLVIALACLLFDELIAHCASVVHRGRVVRRPVEVVHGEKENENRLPQEPPKSTSEYRPWPQESVPYSFPETPLPSSFLPSLSSLTRASEVTVARPGEQPRVWETVDMTGTGIEHFLPIRSPSLTLQQALEEELAIRRSLECRSAIPHDDE